MKTIVRKTLTTETRRHDFDNEFAYVEVWLNSCLKDCYFAEKEFLYPDGTIKNGGIKYFFCNDSFETEKKIKNIKYNNFSSFENLYFYDQNGNIVNIKDQ
jgi:hypothetical protein